MCEVKNPYRARRATSQVRLFLDIAGVIAIYFMSPASRTYPGTAIYFMFWNAIYSYFDL